MLDTDVAAPKFQTSVGFLYIFRRLSALMCKITLLAAPTKNFLPPSLRTTRGENCRGSESTPTPGLKLSANQILCGVDVGQFLVKHY